MENFSWTCPYCNHDTTITKADVSEHINPVYLSTKPNNLGLHFRVILCPNPKCREYSIYADLNVIEHNLNSPDTIVKTISRWNLKPLSNAKPLPDYIPEAIRKDYEEACLILELSPKASATLSRRCLQGMIRDFWKVRGKRLVDEINGIKEKIELQTWNAIDGVRNIGNIGAHMEKDIDLIIDVDPNEATKLIELIEMLIKDWYINRHDRELLVTSIIKSSESKKPKK